MGLYPRDWVTHYHLICLTGFVAISLTLIIVGGSLSSWCIRYGTAFECHSLLHSDRVFSCLFKLIPTGIIFCLIISLFMFIILIIGQVCIEYTGIAKKEYQLVARLVNILTLSIAIILIMIVLLQWFHPPLNSSKNILIAMVSTQEETNDTSKPKQQRITFATISPDDPSYLNAMGAQRRSMLTYHKNFNHGPNLFFAAFIILFITLLGFVIGHRI
ncbi:unnamed protein product [Rotaria sordida]|uniref:Uncharacterized protein n=1 Tax=Rotaria sordida TaxID=392033 RepID=A0A818R6C3_9BILA|nr:unnamed protein product [Rotaria sordida]CAF0726781.1 unnamed protein product [Rotaria sordida]CAF0732629.1 unnamed protein product [Rotaria sordida]CAF0800577.1 unnamed protein product [Rotaria sordida]CAF3652627.1 unnamed protein product [Rotaria sordida]